MFKWFVLMYIGILAWCFIEAYMTTTYKED